MAMNKIKTLLKPVMKYVFWIGCVAVLLISTGSWFTARSSLKSEFEKNLGDIKTSFQTAGTLKTKQSPPNEHSNAAMDQLTQRAHRLVTEAWRKQYSHQETILRWPRELREDFIRAVEPLKPIETRVEFPTPPHQELKVDFRQRYANYVQWLLPSLAEAVGSVWSPGRDRSGIARMPGQGRTGQGRTGGVAERPPLVVWDASDQSRLYATHFDWERQPDSAPTTLQVLYAQEDLWILHALMHIIRRTNGDIDSPHEAIVKTINSVMIGPSAVGRAGEVMMLGGRRGTGMGMDDMGMDGMGMDGMGMDGMGMDDMGMGGMESEYDDYGGDDMGMGMGGTATRGPRDPADLRYVDNEYQPLRAERVREAMRSGSPEDAFLVVAKRKPIRLNLVVDQRRLHRLLAECGNSPLPVEIRQVRVNRVGGARGGLRGLPRTGGGGDFAGGMGAGGMGMGSRMMGGGGGYDDFGGGYDDYDMGGGGYDEGYGTAGRRQRTEISRTTSYDVPIELYGIIYLYNPVDEQKLRIEEGPAPAPALTGAGPRPAPTAG